MGNSLEQYRAVVGGFNSVHAKHIQTKDRCGCETLEESNPVYDQNDEKQRLAMFDDFDKNRNMSRRKQIHLKKRKMRRKHADKMKNPHWFYASQWLFQLYISQLSDHLTESKCQYYASIWTLQSLTRRFFVDKKCFQTSAIDHRIGNTCALQKKNKTTTRARRRCSFFASLWTLQLYLRLIYNITNGTEFDPVGFQKEQLMLSGDIETNPGPSNLTHSTDAWSSTYCMLVSQTGGYGKKRKLNQNNPTKKRCTDEIRIQTVRSMDVESFGTFKPLTSTLKQYISSTNGLSYHDMRALYKQDINILHSVPKDTVSIVGDGNCLFRAISYSISNNAENHALVRSILTKSLYNSDCTSFIRQHSGITDYELQNHIKTSNMSTNGTWGTAIEILTTCFVFDLRLVTYEGNNTWNRFGKTDCTIPCIYLDHSSGNHYNVVTRVQQRNITAPSTSHTNISSTCSEKGPISITSDEETPSEQFSSTCSNYSIHTFCKSILGTISQHDEVFEGDGHGSNCVINCMSFILKQIADPTLPCNPEYIDDTLYRGIILYRENGLSGYLNTDDIPNPILSEGRMYNLEFHNYFGTLEYWCHNETLTLDDCIKMAMARHNACLITCALNTTCIYKKDNGESTEYYLFDPHRRDLNGNFAEAGKAFVIYSNSLEKIITIIWRTMHSLLPSVRDRSYGTNRFCIDALDVQSDIQTQYDHDFDCNVQFSTQINAVGTKGNAHTHIDSIESEPNTLQSKSTRKKSKRVVSSEGKNKRRKMKERDMRSKNSDSHSEKLEKKRLKDKARYIVDEQYRKQQKREGIAKYANNKLYRENIIIYNKNKYAGNTEYRDKTKLHNITKYAENDEYREKTKLRNVTKYAENDEYRQRKKLHNITKYAENDEYREKTKLRNVTKYAENDEYREKTKLRNVTKYAENDEYRQRKKLRMMSTDKKPSYIILPVQRKNQAT